MIRTLEILEFCRSYFLWSNYSRVHPDPPLSTPSDPENLGRGIGAKLMKFFESFRTVAFLRYSSAIIVVGTQNDGDYENHWFSLIESFGGFKNDLRPIIMVRTNRDDARRVLQKLVPKKYFICENDLFEICEMTKNMQNRCFSKSLIFTPLGIYRK